MPGGDTTPHEVSREDAVPTERVAPAAQVLTTHSHRGGARHGRLWSVSTPTVAEAEEEQRRLAARVVIPAERVPWPRTVAGLDVSYEQGSDRVAAAAVVVDVGTGATVEQAVAEGVATFPYVPGLLAFREVPILLTVLERLATVPDLLLCDGQGIAHPRRCGLACHLGVVVGRPSVGSAKNHYVGEHAEPGTMRGDRAPLVDGGEIVGEVVRTRDRTRPVYVSPGHLVGVAQATDVVLDVAGRYRVPDPIRLADQLSRRALREA